MKTGLLVVFLVACSGTVFAQTEPLCPWLTIGTAAKMLGGDVTLMAHSNNNWDGSCVFTRNNAAFTQTLTILVGNHNTRPCPEGSQKIAALGNEAVQCRQRAAQGQPEDTIAGRVRGVFFVVSITASGPAPQGSAASNRTDPNTASPVERVAEQVSGSLY